MWRRVGRWRDSQTETERERRTEMERLTDRDGERQTDVQRRGKRLQRETDRQTEMKILAQRSTHISTVATVLLITKTEREKDTHRDRQTDRRRERERDLESDRLKERVGERQKSLNSLYTRVTGMDAFVFFLTSSPRPNKGLF